MYWDAALYLSCFIGAKVADVIRVQTLAGLQAHGEYLESRDVAQRISKIIDKASRPLASSEALRQT
jgi:hypothetical protein